MPEPKHTAGWRKVFLKKEISLSNLLLFQWAQGILLKTCLPHGPVGDENTYFPSCIFPSPEVDSISSSLQNTGCNRMEPVDQCTTLDLGISNAEVKWDELFGWLPQGQNIYWWPWPLAGTLMRLLVLGCYSPANEHPSPGCTESLRKTKAQAKQRTNKATLIPAPLETQKINKCCFQMWKKKKKSIGKEILFLIF